MAGSTPTSTRHRTFRAWLGSEIERQQISRREISRRLASKHPAGVTTSTVETFRSSIHRYLTGERVPTVTTRIAFAEALGVDPAAVPMSDEDEEEDLDVALQGLLHQQAAMARQLERLVKQRERSHG